MKMFTLLFIVLFQASAFAAPLYCGGTTNEGQTVQVVVDHNEGTVELNQQVSNGGMPPYPYKNVETWAIVRDDSTGEFISIEGVTNRVTTGTAGRISLEGKVVRKTPRTLYSVQVKIRPESRLVRPVVEQAFAVNCAP